MAIAPSDAELQEMHAHRAVLRGDVEALSTVADVHLPDLLEQVDSFVAEQEVKLAPARAMSREIRNEIERRLDAQGATALKLGDHVVRFEKVPAKALVRNAVLHDPTIMAELREIIPAEILTKAIREEVIPETTTFRTHVTFIRQFAGCGTRAAELMRRLLDEGVPGRRLVIEREQKRVATNG